MLDPNFLVSKHFIAHEVEFSETAERAGIDNSLPKDMIRQVMDAASKLDLVRDLLGIPINVNSWYRCPELQKLPQFYNPTSQHPLGIAIDFTASKFGPPTSICKYILDRGSLIQFDQLILEYTWVHISFAVLPGMSPRRQVLSLLQNKRYAEGLTDRFGNKL